jgi:hypothetical protein
MDKLKGVQEGLREAANFTSGMPKRQARALNKAIRDSGIDNTEGAIKKTIESFLGRLEGGYSGADILSDAGNPRLTSMFSQVLPSSMGGVRNVRLTAAPEASGLGKLVSSADDVAKMNISGLDDASIKSLKNLATSLKDTSIQLNASHTGTGLPEKALMSALAIQKFNPAAAKEIVAASGQADRAAAHLMAPIMLGLGGSAVGSAADSLLGGTNKAYGAVSGLQNAGNYVSGTIPSNMADSLGITAARKHFNDNYGKYLLGGAIAAPMLYHMYRTPMREDLRTRGRI